MNIIHTIAAVALAIVTTTTGLIMLALTNEDPCGLPKHNTPRS